MIPSPPESANPGPPQFRRGEPGGDGFARIASMPEPLYTADNVRIAYQLNWSLAIFWNQSAPSPEWLEPLQTNTEPDGVRILEHRFTKPNVSQLR